MSLGVSFSITATFTETVTRHEQDLARTCTSFSKRHEATQTMNPSLYVSDLTKIFRVRTPDMIDGTVPIAFEHTRIQETKLTLKWQMSSGIVRLFNDLSESLANDATALSNGT